MFQTKDTESQRRREAQKLLLERQQADKMMSTIRTKEMSAIDEKLAQRLKQKKK